MNVSKLQITTIIGAIALLLSLVLLNLSGFTKPSTKKGESTAEKQESFLAEEVVLSQARNALDSAQTVWLSDLDKEKAQATSIDKEAEVLKLISRTWIEYNNYLVAGYYAKKVAELVQTAEAWGIAGTTYGTAYNVSKDPDVRKLAAQKAIEALGQAKELEPDNLQHPLNEAVMYLELSSVDASVMPMKGVQMLQKLDTENPDNLMINMTLARLSAVRSGDLEKAKPRFEKVIAIAKNQEVSDEILLEAHYYLIECYKQENNKEKVLLNYDGAIELSTSKPEMREQMKRAKQDYIDSQQEK